MIEIHKYSERDVEIIRKQLNSNKICIAGIIERCNYGFPRIMLLEPVTDDGNGRVPNYKSISNLIWLTCPYLNEEIHKLEQSGYIGKISKLINNDRELSDVMNSAQADFYYLRKNIFQSRFGSTFSDDLIKVLSTGIGGIRDSENLKCLHVHFAHYRICELNVAGRIVSELLKFKYDCNEERCRNAVE